MKVVRMPLKVVKMEMRMPLKLEMRGVTISSTSWWIRWHAGGRWGHVWRNPSLIHLLWEGIWMMIWWCDHPPSHRIPSPSHSYLIHISLISLWYLLSISISTSSHHHLILFSFQIKYAHSISGLDAPGMVRKWCKYGENPFFWHHNYTPFAPHSHPILTIFTPHSHPIHPILTPFTP